MTTAETSGMIYRTAAEWAARIDRGLSPDEQEALELWASQDARRLGALARAQAVVASLDGCDIEAGLAARPPPVHASRRAVMAGGAIAAGVAAAVGLPMLLGGDRTYVSAKGELRTVRLADGSSILMNTQSRLRVRFSRRRRLIDLQAGEALFDVAHDADRPFVVRSRAVDVRAIGTSFSVCRLPDRPLEVRVRQGFVEVGSEDRGAPPPTSLMPGCRATATERGEVHVRHVGVPAVLKLMSWRKGLLDVDGFSLAEAVAEFGRYSDHPIVLDDPSLGAEPVSGLYRTSDAAAFAAAAAAALKLRLIRTGGVIHLAR